MEENNNDVYKTPSSDLSVAENYAGYALASRGQRFLNMVIDFVFFIVFAFIVGVVMAFTGTGYLLDEMNETVFGIILMSAYYFPQEAIWGRTLAKLITKTKVVDLKGEKAGVGKVLGRTLCRFIPFEALTFLFGNGRPHGIHDKLPNTKVITLKKA